MNHNMTQGVGGPLARIGRRVAAIVAECNHAACRVARRRISPTGHCALYGYQELPVPLAIPVRPSMQRPGPYVYA
jgi:hypothetical protein